MTTYYVAVYETDLDTTYDVQEFEIQDAAQKALTEACDRYQDQDKDVVASVSVDGLHYWEVLQRDSEYPHTFRPEDAFQKLLDFVQTIDRSELEDK